MSELIFSLEGTSVWVMGNLKEVTLSIITGYTMLIIPSREILISIYLRSLLHSVLKWWRIVALFLFTDSEVINVGSWFYYTRAKSSLQLPLLVNEPIMAEFLPLYFER